MEQEPFLHIERNLQDVPKGTLIVEHHFDKQREQNLFTESFQCFYWICDPYSKNNLERNEYDI